MILQGARWTTKDNAAVPRAEILNDVVVTPVYAAFSDDERTWAVTARLLTQGTAWMSGPRWPGRDVLRISASNWPVGAHDVTTSVDIGRRAAPAARPVELALGMALQHVAAYRRHPQQAARR